MPRFYFNTDDGLHPFRDEDGTDLPSLDDVPRETLGLLSTLVDVEASTGLQTIVAIVCDATGAAVMRATLSLTTELYNN